MMERKVGNLPIYVFETRKEMGEAAAKEAAEIINAAIAKNSVANVVFAAAPSQFEAMESLLAVDVDWTKVRGFHQDEYIGLPPEHPAGFGNFMRRYLFDKLPFMELHYMLCEAEAVEAKCEEYAALLKKYTPDLIFLGIGENGHLAFNDPAVADFDDPKVVKVVELDDICRNQQVNDSSFTCIDEVPPIAMTLTMSEILRISRAITVVPGPRKAAAVEAALNGPITTACPASVLRNHPGASLYLDRESAASAF